uniref:Uncharacterized protein n=1 Tax=Cacopsylla melanoneura TaxID=428564 RepID=A0A8D8XSR5_9HEMI
MVHNQHIITYTSFVGFLLIWSQFGCGIKNLYYILQTFTKKSTASKQNPFSFPCNLVICSISSSYECYLQSTFHSISVLCCNICTQFIHNIHCFLRVFTSHEFHVVKHLSIANQSFFWVLCLVLVKEYFPQSPMFTAFKFRLVFVCVPCCIKRHCKRSVRYLLFTIGWLI